MARALASFVCNDVARVAIALLLVGITGALLLTHEGVPDVLWALDGAAVGFYFGGVGKTM